MTDSVPVILDTDIGSDIDDAICLAYLLAEPRCELVGITTVSGRPQERAALADAVCRGAGRREVSIHSGVDKATLGGIVQPDCPQAEALPQFDHRAPESFEAYAAVPWLRRTIRARPHEITLLGIGPMMNIGALFASDPEIPSLLGGLVVMCGCFFEPRPYSHEWNARLDPTATAIVYAADVPDHRSVGLDVTMHCKMSAPGAIRRFRDLGGALSVVAAMAETRPRPPGSEMIFHDPLTGACVFEPTLCDWESGDVSVELLSRSVAGMTHFQRAADGAQGRHRAARRVDPERFFARYFSVFDQPHVGQ